MPDKPNLLTRIIQRFAGNQISDIVEKRLQEQVDKATAADTVRFSPRPLAWPGSTVPKYHTLGISFQTLRDFADFYPVARACIEFRKSQITHLDWNITPKELNDKTVLDEKNIADAKALKQLLRYPTGKKDSSFSNWLKQILEDLLVIDAVAIYRRRNRRGDIIGYLPVDGASIELLLEQDGTTPDAPKTAYVQKINGQVKAELSVNDLIYAMMTPKTYTAYGLAPLETLIITVTTALKLQAFNLGFLAEGNVPEGFITLPKDIASSRDQLKEWQDAWDAMLSGDPRFQRKLKFLPEGMKYEPSIKVEDMTFERFEKWLLQCTASVFGIHPSAIGFNFDVNRASADSAWEAGRERSLFPTALFLKEIMDRIIQEDMGYTELEFSWTNIDPTNRAEEAKVVTSLVSTGLMSIDEWRLGEGLKPSGIKDPFIVTPVGPMFLKDLQRQSDQGQLPVAPYKPQTNSPAPAPQEKAESVADELRKWKKAALNDFKSGKPFREFHSDIIDDRMKELVADGLKKAVTKEDVVDLFYSFINSQNDATSALLEIYDKVDGLINDKSGNVVPEPTPPTQAFA